MTSVGGYGMMGLVEMGLWLLERDLCRPKRPGTILLLWRSAGLLSCAGGHFAAEGVVTGDEGRQVYPHQFAVFDHYPAVDH